ncbi:MAG: MaoC family dehydratase [Gaiellales bacterium]
MALHLEDLPVGTVLTSEPRTISAQDIADYCELSGDHNPLHTDDEWVRANTPFRERIAHGLLVLGVSSGSTCAEMDALTIIAYLSESRNFRAPTYPGESVVTTWEVVESRPSNSKPEQGLVRFAVTCRKQDGTVVQDGEDLLLVARRPA